MMRVSGKEREVELTRVLWTEHDYVKVDPRWDAREQVDFLIMGFNGVRLKRCIAVQLTFRRKSLAKLERFARRLPKSRFNRILYLEVDDRCSFRDIREAMISLLPGLQSRYGRKFQLYASVDRHGKVTKLMTVQDAVDDLRKHYETQTSVSGTIVRCLGQSYVVRDAHQDEYRMHRREIVDRELMEKEYRGEPLIGSLVRGTWLLTSNQGGATKWLYYVSADRRH